MNSQKTEIIFANEDKYNLLLLAGFLAWVIFIISHKVLDCVLLFFILAFLLWPLRKLKTVFHDNVVQVQNSLFKNKHFWAPYSEIISVTVGRIITRRSQSVYFNFVFDIDGKKRKCGISTEDDDKARELLRFLHQKNVPIIYGEMDPELKYWVED